MNQDIIDSFSCLYYSVTPLYGYPLKPRVTALRTLFICALSNYFQPFKGFV